MEGENGVHGLIPHVGEIAIPILVASQGSDTGMQGGDPKYSRASESEAYSVSNAAQDKVSNRNPANSESLRRRHLSKVTESDSTLSELEISSLSTERLKFTRTKSRVMEVEQSDSPSSRAVFQSNDLKNTSSRSRGSLSQKIKSMRAGTLPPSEGKDDDDDCHSGHDEDDEKEEEGNQKADEKNAKPRRFSKIGKKLKAIDVVMEWILFTGAMVVLIASLYADDMKTRVIWGLEIWKWCVLVAVVFCGRLVTGWAKDSIVFLIETKFLFNERVVYFIHGVKQSVRVAIWFALVLVAWVLLIDRRLERRSKETTKVLNYITKALISSLVGAVMWMVKTLLVKLVAASFHVKTFFEKIREAISDEYVLWTLSVPPSLNKLDKNGGRGASSQFFGLKVPKGLSFGHKEDIEEDNQQKIVQEKTSQVHKEEEITLKKLGRMKPGKMPASTMGQLIDRIKSSKLSIVTGAVDENIDDGGEQKDITNRSEATQAASQIFQNVLTSRRRRERERERERECERGRE